MTPEARTGAISTLAVSHEHIEVTPGTCGGQPRIAGHRVKVQHVVIWHQRLGMSLDEIVATYPDISLGDVHAALAYYYDHRDEIDHQIREDEAFVTQGRATAGPSLVERKLAGRHAADDSLPPG